MSGCGCGCQPCKCAPQAPPKAPPKACCGDPPTFAVQPPGPRPGFTAGRGKRPVAPPGTDSANTRERFQGVLLDEIRRGFGPGGPRFGPRAQEYLPWLLIRAHAGDRGARPVQGIFWDSPDIFIAPNLAAPDAPPVPTTRGAIAQAGAPNTLWAHVWNLGRAPVVNARVEFHWSDPTLGFDATSCTLIGVAHVDLGERDSGRAHTYVKCPVTWFPQYVAGGHECLLVRCFEPLMDALPVPYWDARLLRHVAQRNISVIRASSPATAVIPLRLGCSRPPGPARIQVERVPVAAVEWLTLFAASLGHPLREAARPRDSVGVLPPTKVADPSQRVLVKPESLAEASRRARARVDVERECDELETQLVAYVDGLEPGECAVYRVTQRIESTIIGGYTVIAYRPAEPIGREP